MVGDGPPLHCRRFVVIGCQHLGDGIPGSRRRHTPKLAAVLMFVILWQAAFGLDGNTQTLASGSNRALNRRIYDAEFDIIVSQAGRLSKVVSALLTEFARESPCGSFVVIILGGWVSSNYAALACYDFPSCDGTYTPDIDLQEGLMFSERWA